GLEELKAAILATCRKVEERTGSEWFRLAIDRSFVVQGHGTVVTGSVMSGSVKVGGGAEWVPRRGRGRVRSLQNHGMAVDEVHRGMRAAINLAGIHHDEVLRGQELAAPGYLEPSRIMTVRLECPADSKRTIRHRTTVRFHIGTAEIISKLSLLDSDGLEAGQGGLAQVFLREAAVAAWGQPFIIRGASALHTLGGGQGLQPVAKKIRRRHIEMLAKLESLSATSPVQERALAAAWFAGYSGLVIEQLVRGAGARPDNAQEILA